MAALRLYSCLPALACLWMLGCGTLDDPMDYLGFDFVSRLQLNSTFAYVPISCDTEDASVLELAQPSLPQKFLFTHSCAPKQSHAELIIENRLLIAFVLEDNGDFNKQRDALMRATKELQATFAKNHWQPLIAFIVFGKEPMDWLVTEFLPIPSAFAKLKSYIPEASTNRNEGFRALTLALEKMHLQATKDEALASVQRLLVFVADDAQIYQAANASDVNMTIVRINTLLAGAPSTHLFEATSSQTQNPTSTSSLADQLSLILERTDFLHKSFAYPLSLPELIATLTTEFPLQTKTDQFQCYLESAQLGAESIHATDRWVDPKSFATLATPHKKQLNLVLKRCCKPSAETSTCSFEEQHSLTVR